MSESFPDKTAPFSGYRRMGLFTFGWNGCMIGKNKFADLLWQVRR